MTDRLITHLRHVDLAVPDHARQLDFFTSTWGLTGRAQRLRPHLPGRRRIPRAVRRPAAEGGRQADRPDRLRRGQRRRRGHPGRAAGRRRGAAGQRAGPAADPGRRVRVPVLRQRGPHRRDQRRRRRPGAPQDRGGRVHPGPAVPRGDQLRRPRGHPRVLREAPGLRAVGHPDAPAHGRNDVVHADQLLASQPGDRPRPAPVAAPRARSSCAASTSTCAAPAGCCARGWRRSGDRAVTWPATTPSATSSTRTATPSSTPPSWSRSTRTPGTRTCTTSPSRGRRPVGYRQPDERVRRRQVVQRPGPGPVRGPPGLMRFATWVSGGIGHRRGRRGARAAPLPPGVTVLDLVRAGLPAALAAGTAALSAAPVPVGRGPAAAAARPADRAGLRRVRGARRGRGRQRRGRHGVVPEWYQAPTFYFTNPYALIGAHDDVPVPPGSQLLDFELEVAAVVGRDGASLSPEQAAEHIFGYTILNDWSARDLQRAGDEGQPRPGQGQGLRHHARPVAGDRRRTGALPGRRRLPGPGLAGVGQRYRGRPGPAVEHGLAVRGADRLRLPRHLGPRRATCWARAPAATAAAWPSCGAARRARPPPLDRATSSR